MDPVIGKPVMALQRSLNGGHRLLDLPFLNRFLNGSRYECGCGLASPIAGYRTEGKMPAGKISKVRASTRSVETRHGRLAVFGDPRAGPENARRCRHLIGVRNR